ncbi:hypothetical protein AB0H88_02860 [Nonomuraea sp. NPDC050680]|uniref:hypothetical protein n=1 Tax=Nonomuraea sp. NPDC050680 TaxID=3154630 RepID=UPI0033E32EC8
MEEALLEEPAVEAVLVEDVLRLPEAVRRPEVAVSPEAALFGVAVLLDVEVLLGVAELLDVAALFCSVSLFGVAAVAVAVRLRAPEAAARLRVVADVPRLRGVEVVRVPEVVARPRAVAGGDACMPRAGVPLSPCWPRRAISAPAPMAAATGQSSTPNAASAPSAP